MLKVSGVTDNSIILDSFAGSGTTAHALLKINKEQNMERKFILVECEDYAEELTATRVRKVMTGVKKHPDMGMQSGYGGGFTFCTLGDPIDVESLLVGKALPSYESLAKYIFYTATGHSLGKIAKPSVDGFVGETELFRVHLLYQPDKEWLRTNEAALNADKVKAIVDSNKTGKRAIVFAVAKFMSQKELTKKKIEFCQLPYAVHRILGD